MSDDKTALVPMGHAAIELFGDKAKAEVMTSRADWLDRRRSLIGGSDAPVVLGVSRFSNRLRLYAEKRGLVEDSEPTMWQRLGHLFEPVVASMYQEEAKREVIDLGAFTLLRDREHPFLGATLDRAVVDPKKKGPGVLECKITAFGDDWGDEPPIAYQVQLAHQMLVSGAEWGSLAVIIGNRQFKYYDQEANPRFIKILLKAELEFWARVQDGNAPEVDATEFSAQALKALYPSDDGNTVELPAEAFEWLASWEKAKASAKALTEEADLNEHRLKAAIGSATFGTVAGKTLSLKTTPVKGHSKVVEPYSYRRLRVVGEK